jgi:hypothetical protein
MRRDRSGSTKSGALTPLVFCAFLVFCVEVAQGFCPKPTPKVCSEFFRSDAVFVGIVMSEEVVPADGGIEGWLYRLRVTRPLRGTVDQTVIVHTPNDSGRLPLAVGRSYLLFAALRGGQLEIRDDCGPLSDPAHAGEAIQEIQKLDSAIDASVEGEVRRSTPSGDGAPGVTVTVSGMGRVYRSTTDARGLFRVSVPPGRYQIDVDASVAVQWDLNSLDLKNVELTRGQCAQTLFITR